MLNKQISYLILGVSIVCVIVYVVWSLFFQFSPEKVIVIVGASDDEIFSLSEIYDATQTDVVLFFSETTDSAFIPIQRAENFSEKGSVHIFLYGAYENYIIDYVQEDVTEKSQVIIDSRFADVLPEDVLARSTLMDLSQPRESFSRILMTYTTCSQLAVDCFT
jgi:hypothetical protein